MSASGSIRPLARRRRSRAATRTRRRRRSMRAGSEKSIEVAAPHQLEHAAVGDAVPTYAAAVRREAIHRRGAGAVRWLVERVARGRRSRPPRPRCRGRGSRRGSGATARCATRRRAGRPRAARDRRRRRCRASRSRSRSAAAGCPRAPRFPSLAASHVDSVHIAVAACQPRDRPTPAGPLHDRHRLLVGFGGRACGAPRRARWPSTARCSPSWRGTSTTETMVPAALRTARRRSPPSRRRGDRRTAATRSVANTTPSEPSARMRMRPFAARGAHRSPAG